MATKTTIENFKGIRLDVPAKNLSNEYLTELVNSYCYRGALKRVGGYQDFLTTLTGVVQYIRPFEVHASGVKTIRLVLCTTDKIYALNDAGTAWIDITRITDPTSSLPILLFNGITDSVYGGSVDNTWNGDSLSGKLYLANYACAPQVWNGTLTDGSAVEVAAGGVVYDSTTGWATVTKTSHGLTNGEVVYFYLYPQPGNSSNLGEDIGCIGTFQIYYVDADTFKYQPTGIPQATSVGSVYYKVTCHCGNAIVPNKGFKAKTVRSYENHLFYLNVYDGSKDQPFTVYYSDIADPAEWSSGDAGWTAKPERNDAIVTAEEIGSYLAIYKDRSIFMVSYTSSDLLFEFTPAMLNTGAYSSHSVVNIDRTHYFMARNERGLFDSFRDFNGESSSEIESSLSIRDMVRQEINESYPESCAGYYLSDKDMVIWIYPTSISTNGYPTKGVIWNKTDDTWSFIELNKSTTTNITCLSEFQLTRSLTWNDLDDYVVTDTTTVNQLPYPFGSSAYNGKQRLTVLGSYDGSVYQWNNTTTFDGTAVSNSIGREDFHLNDDMDKYKLITRVYLTFTSDSAGNTLYFNLGSRKGFNDESEIEWLPVNLITTVSGQSTYKIDLFCRGRLFSYRLYSSDTGNPFTLEKISFDFNDGGYE